MIFSASSEVQSWHKTNFISSIVMQPTWVKKYLKVNVSSIKREELGKVIDMILKKNFFSKKNLKQPITSFSFELKSTFLKIHWEFGLWARGERKGLPQKYTQIPHPRHTYLGFTFVVFAKNSKGFFIIRFLFSLS